MTELVLPLRTTSLTNAREHWRERYRRAESHRTTTRVCLEARLPLEGPSLPCVVTLTRIAPGTLDDDNLPAALKSVRDGAADALRVKDNDPRVSWRYAQRKAPRGRYAVEIRIGGPNDS